MIKHFLILASLLIPAYSYAELPHTPEQTKEKDGIVYDVKSSEPFTGKVIYYSHDNKPLYLIYDHDFSHRVDEYEDGKKRWSWYYDEGENQVLCEQYFEDKPVEQWSCLGC